MRVGIRLPAGIRLDWPEVRALAVLAEDLGLDLLALPAVGGHDSLTVAAALASCTRHLRVVAEVPLGQHPVHVAERACVTDRVLAGRLAVVLTAVTDGDELSEIAEVVALATSGRPLRYLGRSVTVPARLPANDAASWTSLTVTPSPDQLVLPLWLAGPSAALAAAELGLPVLVDADDDATVAARRWASVDAALGRAAGRLVRPAVRVAGADPADLVAGLRLDRELWGLDTVLIELPAGGPAGRQAALRRVATWVWPRLQLDELPEGLEDYWRQTLG